MSRVLTKARRTINWKTGVNLGKMESISFSKVLSEWSKQPEGANDSLHVLPFFCILQASTKQNNVNISFLSRGKTVTWFLWWKMRSFMSIVWYWVWTHQFSRPCSNLSSKKPLPTRFRCLRKKRTKYWTFWSRFTSLTSKNEWKLPVGFLVFFFFGAIFNYWFLVIAFFSYWFGSFGKNQEIQGGRRLRTWRNSYVIWRHQLMFRTSRETFLVVLSAIRVRGAECSPPVPGGQKRPVWIGLISRRVPSIEEIGQRSNLQFIKHLSLKFPIKFIKHRIFWRTSVRTRKKVECLQHGCYQTNTSSNLVTHKVKGPFL